jgi:hypothetical protein
MKEDEMGWACSAQGEFWLESLKSSEDLVIDGRIILKWFVRRYGGRVWTGFIWLRIGAGFL